MDKRAWNHKESQFKEWKIKVKKHLPELTIQFYTAKLNGLKVDDGMELQLGSIIRDINNQWYGSFNERMMPLEFDARISARTTLEKNVQDFIKYVKTECSKIL